MSKDDFFYPGNHPSRERAILVGSVLSGQEREEEEDNLRELAMLASTAGAKVLGSMIQSRRAPDVSTFIGRGKLEELKELCEEREVNLILFDHDLSPIQARNIETFTGINVADRTELILDIFAKRARSRQAHLQVELAQLEYLRPRLRRMWEHLGRQAGGIGSRGPGETQLEVDRRRLSEKVSRLRDELEHLHRVSETKAGRRRENSFTVALVGYTNVGKSTIMRAMTGSDVFIEDALFATLDATTRRLKLDEDSEVLLTDTIGFIRKLPHHLIESFKATLSELKTADLLLHVADLSSPVLSRQIEAVDEVLGEMDVDPASALRVFNKADEAETGMERWAERHWPGSIVVSALENRGLDELRFAILERRRENYEDAVLRVPVGQEKLASMIYRDSEVLNVSYDEHGALYHVRAPRETLSRMEDAGISRRES
ncbi:MAG: GTPase HflX [Candidatus Krumholzibacteria bacterium]|jgi:GTP-binding protein HflX|nr:GTPase HflX [Candidatus Krumholzibacteria bacterium]MDP6668566.1 GTPase HflX [Candidatus Krumholzibacteria bacterium]MDP6796875.1 GTPase HflX [Candidatus Krumholzibacteria bacterium]MDP7021818.1 GTPase HflX [Candidatus Krumholzibacteria bacterium]